MRDLSEIEEQPELTDGRLQLRALRPGDKAAVVAALNDELAGRFLWRPPFPYSESDFDEWLAGSGDSWRAQHTANWAVTRADEGEWLGGFSLEILEERQAGEIGYQVAPWVRGQGVATAATRLVRDWAFDELDLERVEIMTDVENFRSQRVALAAGFQFEGVQRGYLTARGRRRDMASFGMVPSDPRAPIVPLPRPNLTDGRIVVRPYEPDDAPAVFRACQDPLIQQCCYFVPAPYTMEDAERFMAEAQWELLTGTTAHCAIVAGSGFATSDPDVTEGTLLGSVNLVHYPEREAGEIGCWVVEGARGRHVASSAIRLIVRFAFEEVGLERLEIMTETPNLASQQMTEKLGFKREGNLRGYLASRGERDDELVDPAHGRIDQFMFALLRKEWEATDG